MTPADATARIAEGMGVLAGSLDRITDTLRETTRRLGRMIALGYVLTFLALCGVGALAWHTSTLHRANQDLHQQTRTVVQTNQALLAELLGRTPRTP